VIWKIAKSGVVVALVAASILAPLAIRHRAEAGQRDRETQLRLQDSRLSELTAENLRLSNLIVRTESSAFPPAETRELLRLRGQIGPLRQAAVEVSNQVVRNQRWAAALSNAAASTPTPSAPDPRIVQAYWPRAQLGFAGYSDPAAALRTTLWAMTQGDTNILAGSVTSEVKAKMLKEDWTQHGTAAEELAASTKRILDSLQPASGFYVVGESALSPDQAVLDVFFEGEGRTRKFAMKKVGGEWKFNALGLAGAANSDVHPGFSVWP
jgi:hypothetical protein